MQIKYNENLLKELIKECVSVIYEDIEIQDDTDLINDLGFDSIGLMQLILEIESKFNITFNIDLKYEEISTFSNLSKYVEERIQINENE
ncbi:MAG: acyl carrier protein [Lachnospiraceae bacterium]|nr:acyl carrier protein [Lachnospiraceae bacterium]